MPLEFERPQALVESVQEALMNLIFSGELNAGERLNEAAIAQSLGVSRSPVREAIRALAQTGLIVIHQNRGAFLRVFSDDEISEMYDFRCMLAREAGERAATRISASDLTRLSEIIDDIERITDAGSVREFFPLNIEFHRIIVVASGNRRLASSYFDIAREHRLFRQYCMQFTGKPEERGLAHQQASNQEHKLILEALRKQDAQAAGELLYQHDLSGQQRTDELRTAAAAKTSAA
tara:strand:- start:2455 stop:3159 length:705 start_codon:yes stop_codon:yes gene_type:complete